MSVQSDGGPYPFEIKRLPAEGLTIRWACPKCGEENSKEYRNDYLKFVVVNGDWVSKYLPECDNCWLERKESYEHQVEMRVVLTVEVREKESS